MVVKCYGRLDPKTNKWIRGCTAPDSRGMLRIVNSLLGKSLKMEE